MEDNNNKVQSVPFTQGHLLQDVYKRQSYANTYTYGNVKNENKTEEENPVTTFNLENAGDSVPAWIKAIQNHK